MGTCYKVLKLFKKNNKNYVVLYSLIIFIGRYQNIGFLLIDSQ
jgi:hypothetical protein